MPPPNAAWKSARTPRARIYGEPYADWKAKHGKEATQEQLFALALAETKHPKK